MQAEGAWGSRPARHLDHLSKKPPSHFVSLSLWPFGSLAVWLFSSFYFLKYVIFYIAWPVFALALLGWQQKAMLVGRPRLSSVPPPTGPVSSQEQTRQSKYRQRVQDAIGWPMGNFHRGPGHSETCKLDTPRLQCEVGRVVFMRTVIVPVVEQPSNKRQPQLTSA